MGKLEAEVATSAVLVSSKMTLGTELTSTFESALGYETSVDNAFTTGTGNSVTRTFEKRTDEKVNNVAWRLVEYEAIVSMKVALQTKVLNDDNTVSWVFSDETYTIQAKLYTGIVREWANGYIEDWYTGDLVFRADFFGELQTETQLSEKLVAVRNSLQ